MKLPEKGIDPDTIFAEAEDLRRQDADWRGGKVFALIYPAGDEVDAVLRRAADLAMFENALNPLRFPSLKTMERDVVSMAGELVHLPEAGGGCLTSGGTESILLAVKTGRERARAERGVTEPQLLVPRSAHPAFAKAAHYFGLELVHIPLDADYRADVDAARDLVTDRTALIAGSAPNYPFGVVDPIPELAALAAERGIAFHTDSCMGGFMLPFLEKLGAPIPPFDFRVPGVSTLSSDVHKYGYCTKGASALLHRSRDSMQWHQAFIYQDWPGGVYGSLAMAGARPAQPIVAAWAVMRFLGWEGYLAKARSLRETTRRIREGIEAIPPLFIHGDPVMSLLAFGAKDADIMAVGDQLDDRGWCLDRQHGPDALHMTLSPEHAHIVDAFLGDLKDAVANRGVSRGVAATYSQ